MKVIATEKGHDGNKLIDAGEIFDMPKLDGSWFAQYTGKKEVGQTDDAFVTNLRVEKAKAKTKAKTAPAPTSLSEAQKLSAEPKQEAEHEPPVV